MRAAYLTESLTELPHEEMVRGRGEINDFGKYFDAVVWNDKLMMLTADDELGAITEIDIIMQYGAQA